MIASNQDKTGLLLFNTGERYSSFNRSIVALETVVIRSLMLYFRIGIRGKKPVFLAQ